MPYYLHLTATSLEQLTAEHEEREAFERGTIIPWPPSSDAPHGCGCSSCREVAWNYYWEENPSLPREYPEPVIPQPPVPVYILSSSADARSAHESRKALQSDAPLTVTFFPTNKERDDWRYRESRKIEQRHTRLPWAYEDWQATLNELHHAYLSVEKPGLIAYTPSEEWGVADRQLRVRPGRYLEQFAPHLTKTEVDEYCAQVKAIDDRNVVKFADTPDDIERVYRHGPSSCMSHEVSSYQTDGIHPVTVYGNSDLQVAYLQDAGPDIRARVVVWPVNKIHSIVYGDRTLAHLLAAQGYRAGSLSGANVRAIRLTSDVYVMPYVDGINGADHVGQFMRLSEDGGEYQAQNTNGTTDASYEREEEPTYYCSNCNNEVSADGDLCDSCEDRRETCVRCEDTFFSDSPHDVDDYGIVCRSCYRSHAHECEDCNTVFMEDMYSSRETRYRRDHALTALCLSCGNERMEALAVLEEERRAWLATLETLRVSLMTRRFTCVSVTYTTTEVTR